MSEGIPRMKVKFQIISIELSKSAPEIMGIMKNPKLDVFKVHCIPVSVLKNQNMGWEKLREYNLEEHSDKLAGEYSKDFDVFSCFIPMTRNTIEINDYEPGKIIFLEVYPSE